MTMSVQATGGNLCYQWQKDGNDLSDDDRHHNTDTDTLHIVKVEKGDSEACYRCHVTNEIREEFSKEAILTVSKLIIDLYEKLSGPLQIKYWTLHELPQNAAALYSAADETLFKNNYKFGVISAFGS